MNHYSGLRNALIAFFLLLSALYALPNVFGSDLAVQISSAGDAVIEQSDLAKVTDALKEKNIRYKSAALSNQIAVSWFVLKIMNLSCLPRICSKLS